MKITIYQNYYLNEQKALLDPAFIPHDNTENSDPEFREYALFLKNYQRGFHKEADYTGILSQKFWEKAAIKGEDFVSFIENNRGYDTYFINPLCFQINTYSFKNVWHQGEFYHPGLLYFVQSILDKLRYDVNLLEIRNDETTSLYCNYFIGNKQFWDSYIAFTKPIYDYLKHGLTPNEARFLKSNADDIIKINYTPFILERLYSTFLVTNNRIRSLGFAYSDDQLNSLEETDKKTIFLFRHLRKTFPKAIPSVFDAIAPLMQSILGDRQEQFLHHTKRHLLRVHFSEQLHGYGLEIGTLREPMHRHPDMTIDYVERHDLDTLKSLNPNTNFSDLVPPTFVDNTDTLKSVRNWKYNYVIAANVLERSATPDIALKHWVRVIKPAGFLYLVITNKSNSLDIVKTMELVKNLNKWVKKISVIEGPTLTSDKNEFHILIKSNPWIFDLLLYRIDLKLRPIARKIRDRIKAYFKTAGGPFVNTI